MKPVINNPCPENWEGMTPDKNGRFCGKCSKIVIDFTKKTTQEIIDFLNARKGEDICGKLRSPVVVAVVSTSAEPVPSEFEVLGLTTTTKSKLSLFAASLYFVFGTFLFTSCGSPPEEEPVGKVGLDSATQAQLQYQQDSIARADSLKNSGVSSSQDSFEIDSAEMMNTMKVLDSIMKAKKK